MRHTVNLFEFNGDWKSFSAVFLLGDLVYVCNFGFGVLFINSYETAVEILEKRGSNYSSRPVTTLSALYALFFLIRGRDD